MQNLSAPLAQLTCYRSTETITVNLSASLCSTRKRRNAKLIPITDLQRNQAFLQARTLHAANQSQDTTKHGLAPRLPLHANHIHRSRKSSVTYSSDDYFAQSHTRSQTVSKQSESGIQVIAKPGLAFARKASQFTGRDQKAQ